MKLIPRFAIELGESSWGPLNYIEWWIHAVDHLNLYLYKICSVSWISHPFGIFRHVKATSSHFRPNPPPQPPKRCIASGNLTYRLSFSSSILAQTGKQLLIAWHPTGSRLSTLKCIHSTFSFLCQDTSPIKVTSYWTDSRLHTPKIIQNPSHQKTENLSRDWNPNISPTFSRILADLAETSK